MLEEKAAPSPTAPDSARALPGDPAPQRARAGTPPLAPVAWLVPALFVLLLAPRLLTFVEAGASRVAWPWQIDYAEGVNLNAAFELSQGHNIYRHNGPDAFLSAPYPPVFFFLTSPVMAFTGPSFGWGRILSLLATAVVALLIFYVVWRLARNWAAGALAGALWLSLSPVIVWSAFFKQDIPAMALDLAGLAWAMRYPTGRRLLVPAVLFALAFYTKQSAISGAAATTLWLLARDWRTGLRFGVVLGALVFVPFGVGMLLTGGGLYEHLIGYHSLPHTGRRFMRSITQLVNEYWPLLLLGGAALVGVVAYLVVAARRTAPANLAARLRESVSGPYALLLAYTVVAWAGTISRLGYEGANFNHLMDGLLPTCILAGLGVAYAGRAAASRQVVGIAGLTLAAGLLAAQLFLYNPPQRWFTSGWPDPEINREMQGIARTVASTPGDMFSEDAYLLLANGKRVIYEDASTFVPLANLGQWDDSAFNRAIRDRRFSLVLLLQGNVRWTEEGLRLFAGGYRLKFPGTVEIYEPRLFPDTPQIALACPLSDPTSGDAIALQGYSLPPGVTSGGARPGGTLRVQLTWQAERQPTRNYATYVHLLNEQGESAAGQDNPATGAAIPTTAWTPTQSITDTASLPLPPDLAPGTYRLVAGMYAAGAEGVQALKPGCVEAYGDAVLLGTVEVRE
jgi:hypothetical protein